MSNLSPQPPETNAPPGVLQCLTSALIAGTIALLMYKVTGGIAANFASHPLHTDNYTAQRIASAVRTLVIGICALGSGIFGFAALGLTALSVQTFVQKVRQRPEPPSQS